MTFAPETLEELAAAPFDAIIDVRSPAEFDQDHLPGAINLPVLSDDERAAVGATYVQDSPFKARKMGAALVAKNAARHLAGPLADHDGAWQPLVYCWRGGQRSGSFASILAQIGWRVSVLEGGYQRYRRLVATALYDQPFPCTVVLLDGYTGTGKTELLVHLPRHGVQTLDLEALAHHRGSALGSLGPQPSQKAFESALVAKIALLDPSRPVVVEAESSRIGGLNLPPRLFEAMRSAPRLEIAAPQSVRAAYLCKTYDALLADVPLLCRRLGHLARLRGKENVVRWQSMAQGGAHLELAQSLIADHYDQAYAKARGKVATPETRFFTERLDPTGLEELAQRIAAHLAAPN